MNFNENQPIYRQIAEHVCNQIINRKWEADQRIPSVRETASLMEVNPNTAMRAFHYLQEQHIISQQRGVGYFVSPDGYSKVRDLMRERFIREELPEFFKKMDQLGYSIEELKTLYNQHKNGSSS